jgi:hypothetical protein
MNKFDILNLGYQKHLSHLEERFIAYAKLVSEVDFKKESVNSLEKDLLILFDLLSEIEETTENIKKPSNYFDDVYFKQAEKYIK